MPDDGLNVSQNDIDLVFLYRFNTFDTDGVLINNTQSPAYTGLNTMSISGAFSTSPERVEGPGAAAPLSSGARASGSAGELFHLPYGPAQSGNASGISLSSSQSFSVGGWMLNQFNGDFKAFISKWAIGAGMRSYEIVGRTGASPSRFWRFDVGSSNGGSTNSIDSPFVAVANNWEHVVGTVDASTSTDNVRLYVSGVLVASGSVTFSPGTSGAHPPTRLFASSPSTSEGVANAVGSSNGGQLAEAFLIRRVLASGEVAGLYESGFQQVFEPSDDSNANDSLKDNVGAITIDAPTLRLTAWNAKDGANPSGMRHTESGSHPAFLQIVGSGSGINFTNAKIGVPSDPVAITIRNVTAGKEISDIRAWLQDSSAFDGVDGYEVSARIKSEWTPNLDMASGGGYLARTQGAASSILRSDLGTTISGIVAQSNATSGEPDVSQYLYLALHTNSDFVIGTYGPTGFNIRISTDFTDV